MAKQYVMINDIIEEHNARMYNLRKYYPFFVLSETAFTQYKDGRYNSLDMGYITMAVLRFFIEENSNCKFLKMWIKLSIHFVFICERAVFPYLHKTGG